MVWVLAHPEPEEEAQEIDRLAGDSRCGLALRIAEEHGCWRALPIDDLDVRGSKTGILYSTEPSTHRNEICDEFLDRASDAAVEILETRGTGSAGTADAACVR
jgi:hypothetical protein